MGFKGLLAAMLADTGGYMWLLAFHMDGWGLRGYWRLLAAIDGYWLLCMAGHVIVNICGYWRLYVATGIPDVWVGFKGLFGGYIGGYWRL